jgi:Tfp pilus assembly protein PilX
MKSTTRHIPGEKGALLIMALLVIGALFFFALMYVRLFATEKQLSQKAEQTLVADEAAQAGINDALLELKKNPAWNAGFSDVGLPRSGALYTVTFNNTQTALPWSTNNGAGSAALTGWNGRTVPPNAVHLVSTGTLGKGKSTRQAIVVLASALFQDHFDTDASQWTEVMGSKFNVKNSNYNLGTQGQAAGEHRTFAGDQEWTDMVIEVKARLGQGGPGYGIYFRSTGIKNVNSYIFQYDPGAGAPGYFTYRKVINGKEQGAWASTNRNTIPDFAQKDNQMSWWYNDWRTIRIEIKGNRFVTYVDDVKVLDATDTANQFPNGQIGLRTWNSSYAQFDQVTVSGGSGGEGTTITVKSRF